MRDPKNSTSNVSTQTSDELLVKLIERIVGDKYVTKEEFARYCSSMASKVEVAAAAPNGPQVEENDAEISDAIDIDPDKFTTEEDTNLESIVDEAISESNADEANSGPNADETNSEPNADEANSEPNADEANSEPNFDEPMIQTTSYQHVEEDETKPQPVSKRYKQRPGRVKNKSITKKRMGVDFTSTSFSDSSIEFSDPGSESPDTDELLNIKKKGKKPLPKNDLKQKMAVARRSKFPMVTLVKLDDYAINIAKKHASEAAVLINAVEKERCEEALKKPPGRIHKRNAQIADVESSSSEEDLPYNTSTSVALPPLPGFNIFNTGNDIPSGSSTGSESEDVPLSRTVQRKRRKKLSITGKKKPRNSLLDSDDDSELPDSDEFGDSTSAEESTSQKETAEKGKENSKLTNGVQNRSKLAREKGSPKKDEKGSPKKDEKGSPKKDEKGSPEKDKSDVSRKGLKRKKFNIIPETRLNVETKDATRKEKERLERVRRAEENKRKVEQNLRKESVMMPSESSGEPVVLEVDSTTSRVLVEVHPKLCMHLKSHQRDGIKFLWNTVIESCEMLKTERGSGCILAHSMGAGKSLQLIAFLHTVMSNEYTKKYIKNCLLICPVNIFRNWTSEFDYWLKNYDLLNFEVFDFSNYKTVDERVDVLKKWKEIGGVMIIGINMFTKLVQDSEPSPDPNQALYNECLADPGPDIVACDEGHMMKNELTKYSKSCKLIRTGRRVILTGTPLQNNLNEYRSMVQFVKPNILGTKKEFNNRFLNPISKGQLKDSTREEFMFMKKRCAILHRLLTGFVHRIDYSVMGQYLPTKYEYVLKVRMTDVQMAIYKEFIKRLFSGPQKCRSVIKVDSCLRSIWSHPWLCLGSKSTTKTKKNILGLGATNEGDEQPVTPADDDMHEWCKSFVNENDKSKLELSSKFMILFAIIEECERRRDKLLVFSQSIEVLNLIESFLKKHRSAVYGLGESRADREWKKGRDFVRIDGGTVSDKRKEAIDKFNDKTNHRTRLFLISTKAGSLGINLVAANRCIIFDASWNPSHDTQALFRIYRFGQSKPVYVYRLVAQGTLEEKIYNRQIVKESLALIVVDKQSTDRHFDNSHIQELFRFEPNLSEDRSFRLPEDDVLASVLGSQTKWIIEYHSHDDLLKNRPEEDLTEEERKAAWDEYQQEKENLGQKLLETQLQIRDSIKEQIEEIRALGQAENPSSQQSEPLNLTAIANASPLTNSMPPPSVPLRPNLSQNITSTPAVVHIQAPQIVPPKTTGLNANVQNLRNVRPSGHKATSILEQQPALSVSTPQHTTADRLRNDQLSKEIVMSSPGSSIVIEETQRDKAVVSNSGARNMEIVVEEIPRNEANSCKYV